MIASSRDTNTFEYSNVLQVLTGPAKLRHLADDEYLVKSLYQRLDRMCAIPRTNKTFGDRNFAAAGTRLCNSLKTVYVSTGP